MTDIYADSPHSEHHNAGSVPDLIQRTRLQSMAALALKVNALDINSPSRRINLALKRAIDIFGSLSALIVLSPLLLLVAVAIRVESRGPLFFVQDRWGKDRKRFRVLKFRSMYSDQCDATGVKQTIEGDTRITRVGAFLRKSNIDELPQLINVLKGDMSLVGPRCHVPGQQAGGMDYEDLIPDYHLRHKMRPGMTGLAQMRGLRGPTTNAARAIKRVRSDLEYIASFNVGLDIAIVIGTIWNEIREPRGF